ncbi:rRNA-processing protein Utp23p [Trichomonascus vanleenenianus]|uniref:rRNA-binding ribosome biosynthesis protein UTP23 n=1 Tax=Trichomonascus vanleenenianus TaxID=2268995 RepID=UPI003EC9AA4C
MKQKRAKAYRKMMHYLHLNFGFREPYQVLIDEEIVLEAVRTRFDLAKGLHRTLQGEVKPMITQCAMEALYKAKNQEAIDLAKTFERRRCGHLPKRPNKSSQNEEDDEDDKSGPLSAFDCMTSVIIVEGKNKHRYCVATQKVQLRRLLAKIPAVPLIYINKAVMIMEPMSPNTERARARIEHAKLTQGLNDPNANKRRMSDEDEEDEGEKPKKKRKGPKQPNPLSIKKKKDEGEEAASQEKKKRRRRHHRSEKTEEKAEEEE